MLRVLALLPAMLLLTFVPQTGTAEPKAQPTVITFGDWPTPRTLDPHLAGDVVSARHVGHLYETLLEYAPFGGQRLQPCLAAEMPAYDRKSLTYTFKLRDDVFFADDECFPEGKGRKLTAADFVFSFKRLAALPDSGGFWVVEGQIAGLDEFREAAFNHATLVEEEDAPSKWVLSKEWWQHLDKEVAGLKAVDARTFTVTLNQHYPQFLQAITLSYGAAVAREAAAKYDLGTHAVGTGPYVLASASDEAVVYKRNPTYRDVKLTDVPEGSGLKPFEGMRLPLTDVLRYEFEPETADAFAAFQRRRYPVTKLDRDEFNQVVERQLTKEGVRGDLVLRKEYRDKGMSLVDYAEPTLHYIAFNMSDKVFGAPAGAKGRALRKAFAMCIDRDEYINRYLNARGTPSDQIVPPGIHGHDKACAQPSQTYDPAGARKLLTDAGFEVKADGENWITSDGATPVTLQVCFRSTAETTKAYAEWLTQCARKVGIELRAELMTFSKFLNTQDEGAGQAYDAGWVMDYPDAQNMLQLLYGPNKSPGINCANYASEEYDRLYEKLAPLSDEDPTEAAQKQKLIIEMSALLERDTPWVLVEYRRIFRLQWTGYAAPPPNSFEFNHQKYAFWTR